MLILKNLKEAKVSLINQGFRSPPPIHKVYASPIHDLVPQMFSKEGRQATQQTLTQQLEKILQNQEQARQGNILGSAPSANLASSQTSSSKKAVRTPLRPTL